MIQRSYYQAHPAFTVVEILVVVAIFAILSTIGIISIASSRNRANLENGIGSMASAIAKIQGYTRAGRSVPDSMGVSSVPRSYGFTVDKTNNPNGFKLFADFPPTGALAPEPSTVPHCFSGGVQLGCDPFIAGGFPKNDTIVESSNFGNNILVFDIKINDGVIPPFDVDRVDMVYVIPTSETILYYLDPVPASPTVNTMIKCNSSDTAAVAIRLYNTATNNKGAVVIRGGAIGGNVKYMLE